MQAQEQEEQQGGVDPDVDTYETMVAGLVKHIFGPGEKAIIEMVKNSQNLAQDIGAATLALVQSAAEQAAQAGKEYDIDMLLGVSTEVIDSMLQIAEAVGVIDKADDQALQEDCLMVAVEGYVATAEPGSEDQEAAQQMLQQLKDSGDFDEAQKTLAGVAKRRGQDTDFENAEPLAAGGVDQGAAPPQPAPQPGGGRRLMAG